MSATLIPYFLACNISAGPAWPYGPEYVYDVSGNTTVRRALAPPAKTENFYTTIYCRPKSQATLSCILNNITTSRENGGMPKYDLLSDRKQFEVDFNEFGAKNLTLACDRNESDETFIRFFATLFTVGSDLTGKTEQDGVFQAMSSSVERFKMNVTIGYPPETEEDSTDNLYELEIVPGIDKTIGKAIEITKEKSENIIDSTWNLEIPPPSTGPTNRTVFQRTEELKYHMKISKHSFESHAREKGLLRYYGSGLTLLYDGYMDIKLLYVMPADSPIPEISESTTCPIFKDVSSVN